MDRSGLVPQNAVSVEVGITKPCGSVFEGIAEIVAGPRDSENPAALAIESADAEIEDEPEIIDADIEINAFETEAVDADVDAEIITTPTGPTAQIKIKPTAAGRSAPHLDH